MRGARWLLLPPALVLARVFRVRLSVGPRLRFWARADTGNGVLVVTLGDSLTQGIGSSRPATSWLGLFAIHIVGVTGKPVRIDNRARYGDRISDVVVDQLPVPVSADVVTLCVGANDAGRTDPKEFGSMLRHVCERLPAGALVGDVPAFQWGPRVEAAAELAGVVREVVAEFPDLLLVEVERATTGASVLRDLAGDFFHPGDPAYRWIADAFIAAETRRRQ